MGGDSHEVLDALLAGGWEIHVKILEFAFEGLVPSFDIVPLFPAYHTMLQPYLFRRLRIPRTSVRDQLGLTIAVLEVFLQKYERVD